MNSMIYLLWHISIFFLKLRTGCKEGILWISPLAVSVFMMWFTGWVIISLASTASYTHTTTHRRRQKNLYIEVCSDIIYIPFLQPLSLSIWDFFFVELDDSNDASKSLNNRLGRKDLNHKVKRKRWESLYVPRTEKLNEHIYM
jgi:hypothetical protein